MYSKMMQSSQLHSFRGAYELYRCEKCLAVLGGFMQLQSHLNTTCIYRYSCIVCKITFTSKHLLQTHILRYNHYGCVYTKQTILPNWPYGSNVGTGTPSLSNVRRSAIGTKVRVTAPTLAVSVSGSANGSHGARVMESSSTERRSNDANRETEKIDQTKINSESKVPISKSCDCLVSNEKLKTNEASVQPTLLQASGSELQVSASVIVAPCSGSENPNIPTVISSEEQVKDRKCENEKVSTLQNSYNFPDSVATEPMSEQVKQCSVSNESEEQCLGENSQAERGILKRMGDSTMGNLPHVESDPVADRLSTIVTEVKNGAVEPEKEVCANDLGNSQCIVDSETSDAISNRFHDKCLSDDISAKRQPVEEHKLLHAVKSGSAEYTSTSGDASTCGFSVSSVKDGNDIEAFRKETSPNTRKDSKCLTESALPALMESSVSKPISLNNDCKDQYSREDSSANSHIEKYISESSMTERLTEKRKENGKETSTSELKNPQGLSDFVALDSKLKLQSEGTVSSQIISDVGSNEEKMQETNEVSRTTPVPVLSDNHIPKAHEMHCNTSPPVVTSKKIMTIIGTKRNTSVIDKEKRKELFEVEKNAKARLKTLSKIRFYLKNPTSLKLVNTSGKDFKQNEESQENKQKTSKLSELRSEIEYGKVLLKQNALACESFVQRELMPRLEERDRERSGEKGNSELGKDSSGMSSREDTRHCIKSKPITDNEKVKVCNAVTTKDSLKLEEDSRSQDKNSLNTKGGHVHTAGDWNKLRLLKKNASDKETNHFKSVESCVITSESCPLNYEGKSPEKKPLPKSTDQFMESRSSHHRRDNSLVHKKEIKSGEQGKSIPSNRIPLINKIQGKERLRETFEMPSRKKRKQNRHGSNEDSKDSRSSSDSDSEFSSSTRSSHKKTYRRKEEDHKSRTRKKYSEKDIKKRRKETSVYEYIRSKVMHEDIRDSRKSAHKKRSFSESDSSERSGSAESSSKRKSYNRERKRSRSRRSPSPKKHQVTSRDSIKSRRTHITRRSEKSPEWSTKHGRHAGETKYRKGTSRKVRAGIISSNNKLLIKKILSQNNKDKRNHERTLNGINKSSQISHGEKDSSAKCHENINDTSYLGKGGEATDVDKGGEGHIVPKGSGIENKDREPTQEESSWQDKNLTDSICGTEKNPICVSEDSQDNNERVNVKALCGSSDSIMKKPEFPESMRSKNMETLCRTEENSSCINQDFLDNSDKQDVELERLAESMRSNDFEIISCKTEPYSEPTIFDQEMSEPMRDENFNKVFIEGKSLKYEDDRLREDTSQDLNEFQSVASDQGRGPSFAQVYIKQEPECEIEKTLHESEKNYLKSEPPVFSDICQDNELSVIHQPDISETYGTTAKCQERMGHRSDYFSIDEMESNDSDHMIKEDNGMSKGNEVSSILFSHCDSDLIHTEDTLSDAGSLGSVILFERDETTDGCFLSKRNKKVHFCPSKEGDKISDATLSENQGNQQTHAEESKSNLVNPKTRASFGRTLRNSHSKRTMLEQKDSKKELQDEAFAQGNKKGTKKQSDSHEKVSMKRVEKNIITYMASKCPECQAMFVLDKYMSINLKTGDVSLKCQKCLMYTCMMGVLHGEVKNIGSGYEHLPMDSKYRVKLSSEDEGIDDKENTKSKNGENEDSEGRNRQNANKRTKAKGGSLKRKTDNKKDNGRKKLNTKKKQKAAG